MALLLSSSCTESKACHHDASIFPGDKPKWYFTKLDHLAYSRWVSKDESRVKKQKVDNAGSEIQIECQQSIKKYIANCGNEDSTKELSEGQFIGTNEESSCMEKDEAVSEEVTPENASH